MIYLDNAATTWPKPESVYTAIDHTLRHESANPGRSGHTLSLNAARTIFDTREALSDFFGVPDSSQVIFFPNATTAINQAIKGLLKPADHVIVSGMEHNAVMRPLTYLQKSIGITVSILPLDQEGRISLHDLDNLITPQTRMAIFSHVSNVTGVILPIKELNALCRRRGVITLLDASQSAGLLPIHMQQDQIDVLAFTGHKALYGPQGTGGLCLNGKISMIPLIHGGTGSASESVAQPDYYPDQLESGTPNTAGIAGLGAGLKFIQQTDLKNILKYERDLSEYLRNQLQTMPEIQLYGPLEKSHTTGIVSFNVHQLSCSEVARVLDNDYGVMSRPGLHCAPTAHQTLNTLPQGTVRLSVGCFNTQAHMDHLINALKKMAHTA